MTEASDTEGRGGPDAVAARLLGLLSEVVAVPMAAPWLAAADDLHARIVAALDENADLLPDRPDAARPPGR